MPEPLGGPLFRFNLTGNRQKIGTDDPRLEDLVADNLDFHEMTESESLLFGRDFGVVTDIETGPNGNLYVVSISNGAVYEIFSTKENPPKTKPPKPRFTRGVPRAKQGPVD